jgi:hypothetical protein
MPASFREPAGSPHTGSAWCITNSHSQTLTQAGTMLKAKNPKGRSFITKTGHVLLVGSYPSCQYTGILLYGFNPKEREYTQ